MISLVRCSRVGWSLGSLRGMLEIGSPTDRNSWVALWSRLTHSGGGGDDGPELDPVEVKEEEGEASLLSSSSWLLDSGEAKERDEGRGLLSSSLLLFLDRQGAITDESGEGVECGDVLFSPSSSLALDWSWSP